MFSKNKNKTDLPSLITTHFPSCTHTPVTLPLQPTRPLAHGTTYHARDSHAISLREVSAWMALPTSLLCLRNSCLSFKAHHKCLVLWEAFWSPQIELTALFIFLTISMEYPCWFLEIQRGTRQETVIVLWGQKSYLINYHTLCIYLPRSYVIELEEHKNRWLDGRNIKWTLTNKLKLEEAGRI